MLTQPTGVVSVLTVRVSRRRVSVSTVSAPGVNTGRETAGVKPTASAYFRYVSIEATTTRASIVIKSIPTREILTHASITMPLSSTRSRTSIKLVPPGALSTAICFGSFFLGWKNEHTARGLTAPLALLKQLSHYLGSQNSLRRFRFARPPLTDSCGGFSRCEFSNLQFELRKPFTQLQVLGFDTLGACRQVCVVAPPVQSNLLCLID